MRCKDTNHYGTRFALILIGILIVAVLVVAVPSGSVHSSAPSAVSSTQTTVKSAPFAAPNNITSLASKNFTEHAPWETFLPPPVPQSSPLIVATYESDCLTPQSVFHPNETICAKITDANPDLQLIWSNSDFVAVQTNTLTSANQSFNFTLSASPSLGDWRVIVYEPFGGSVLEVGSFTVSDAQNPTVDLQVSKSAVSSETSAGAQVVFSIRVTNGGPDSAPSVDLADATPPDTTFVSFSQVEGPVFSCSNPQAGSTGTTVCTIASLARGEISTFLATYLVNGGTAAGSSIDNTASLSHSNNVTDSNSDNNSSTASVLVRSAPCVLTCPSNVTQAADSGQAGAVVTYAAPTTSGDCGQPIEANPASGSFFPAGTTTVTATSNTGGACTFQVTVENPGGLAISLNGASTFALECGTDFDDPGATAVNGVGDPVAVVVSGTVDNQAPASYTLTYTATEGANSVSTTRTVNVSDAEAPVISLDGPNPMTVGCGQSFVDPGASANDACDGIRPINSSGTVDSNTPGTYTITYTASDTHNHTSTATRTVIVEAGGGANPPIITLNGDPQMTVECGSFTDPGATASVGCGGSVPVTTSGTVGNAPGTYTITYTACVEESPGVCDPARTAQVERTVTVEDNTAPTIEVLGANPMTVECHTSFTDPGATAHDACAGDFAATASGTVDPNTVGQYTITYSAVDPSGHSATTVTRIVNVVDTAAPTVTAPPDVTVHTGSGNSSCGTTVSDASLGTASANDACQGSLSVTRSGVPSGNVFPVGQTTVTYSATDAYNHTGTDTQTVTVIDDTAPTISCPANITVYLPLNSTATSMVVNYTAPVGTDNCGGSTTAQVAGLSSGSVFPVGPTTNTFRVTDASGTTAECSFTVTVLYNFTGFFSPVSNIPVVNNVNAGRSLPLKFSLSGNKGLGIFPTGSPASQQIACNSSAPLSELEGTDTPGGSTLTYSPDQYHYNWKTENSWAGTCRQLVVTLNDGSSHTALFKFK